MNLKTTIYLKNCWSGPIKNVRIWIFTMTYFFKKIKKNTCVPKILIWFTVPEIYSVTDSNWSLWDIFLPFYTPPPSPLNLPKIRSLKKWKKLLEISSFYKCVLKTTITWCAVPQIWSETEKTFCHLGNFFLFYPNNPQNQYFETMKKDVTKKM